MNSYLYISVTGNINRFLLKCNKNNINILRINYNSYKSAIILINEKDYKKVLKLKGICKIRIVNTIGLKRYKNKIKEYRIFIICFILGISLLIMLSNIIFEIEITGDNKKLNELITKELINYDIDKYKFKKASKKIEKIKEKIKNKYKDNIEWLNIKESGVKYIISYVERKVDYSTDSLEIYSIAARKSGIVRDIYSYQGVTMVDIGNYVSKGDILISSDIMLNDEIKKQVNAKGKVYAEVWYKVKVEYPLNYKEKKYTNNKRKILYIRIGNNYFELNKYKNYDRNNIISYKNKITGLEIGLEEIKKIELIDKKYSNKEALDLAIKEAKNKIKLKLDKDERIISEKTLNFYSNGSKIILDEFISVYEEIGEKKKIEMGDANDSKDTKDGT